MDQSDKEVTFQVGMNELKGHDNPAADLNESQESGETESNDASNSGPQGLTEISLCEPSPVIGDKLEGEGKYFALRPPLLAIPSFADNQNLRQSAKVVFDEKYGLCSLARWKRRGIRKYYQQQVNLLDCFENDQLETSTDKAISIHDDDAEADSRHKDAVLAKIVFVVNFCLLLTKTIASYLSGSLSVISTVLDSVMDLASGIIVWLTMRAIKNSNPYRYPRGRTRLEPIAVIIVSIIMGIGNTLMIIESVSSVINNTVDPRMALPTVGLVLGVIIAKAALYVLCARRHTSNSDVLAMDQRNDVITNFVALVGALVGTYVWPYADPLGAIGVCTYIALNWFRTAGGQVSLLSGKTAGGETINRIIKLAV
uniref:Cation efflux protein transmembrane domain-containing protein n=1 Tax=Plectus sambesii TaxID=2011161 RepID=A0A914UKI4_9BILA